MTAHARVGCLGIVILDVLGRPVDELPTVQRSLMIDEIRMTVAGTAGGTAVDLARLGLDVTVFGAVGDDTPGQFVRALLEREGIDATNLVVRSDVATSCSILPISSAGVRPAWHLRGANVTLNPDDLPPDWHAGLEVLHYGGVSALPGLDGEPVARLLADARAAGVRTTADCLGIKRDDALEVLTPALPHIDVFLPNRDELALLTGEADVAAGAQVLLDRGARTVLVKLDAEGAQAFGLDGDFTVDALPVQVVDTTGCGDAFCAGVIRGMTLGWDLAAAARLGAVCGSLTAQGLGSDAGIRDLDSTLAALPG